MAKILFDIKYRPQIESGKYRVETKAGCPVRIVCWDMACELPILGLVLLNDEKAEEMAVGFTNEGTNLLGEPLYDKLFLVTPEPELTEFEKKLSDVVGYAISLSVAKPQKPTSEFVKEYAAELLALAREQFINDGYVIEKKAFHDAVNKVDPEVMKEVSEDVDKTGLTEFERRIKDLLAIKCKIFYNEDICGCYDLKGLCRVILECARKQLQPEIDVKIEKAYEQAEKDIIAIIESRISELLGDAQPTPVLRLELQDLINIIKKNYE